MSHVGWLSFVKESFSLVSLEATTIHLAGHGQSVLPASVIAFKGWASYLQNQEEDCQEEEDWPFFSCAVRADCCIGAIPYFRTTTLLPAT